MKQANSWSALPLAVFLATLVGCSETGDPLQPLEVSSSLVSSPAPPPPPPPPPPTPSSNECDGDPGSNITCTCNSGAEIYVRSSVNRYLNNAARRAGFSNVIVSGSGNTAAFPNLIDGSEYWREVNSLQTAGLGSNAEGYWKWFPNPAFVGGAPNYTATADFNALLVYWNNNHQCAYWMTASTNLPATLTASRVPRTLYRKFEALGLHNGLGIPVGNPKPSYNVAGLTGVSHQVFSKGVVTAKGGDDMGFAIGSATLEEKALLGAYLWDHIIDAFDPYSPLPRRRYSFNKPGLPLAGNAFIATCTSYFPETGKCHGTVTGRAVKTVANPQYDSTYSVKVGAVTNPATGSGVAMVTGVIEDAWNAAYPGGPLLGKPFSGALGYPVGRQFTNASGVLQQNFEKGYIVVENETPRIVTPPLCTTICASGGTCDGQCWHDGQQTNCLAAGQPSSAATATYGGATMGCGGVFVPGAPEVKFHEDMLTGRLSNQILTKYLEYPADVDGAATGANPDGSLYKVITPPAGMSARFAATCSNWHTVNNGFDDESRTENISDVSMIVVVRQNTPEAPLVTTLYSDDGAQAKGNGLGAYLEYRGAGVSYRYTVFVYSNRLNTAKCELRHWASNDDVLAVAPAMSARQIGGRMIRVGALPAGDYFEVDSYNGAPSQPENARTRMMLFRFPADLAGPPTRGGIVGGSPLDYDARLNLPAQFDCNPGVSGIQYCYDDSRENYLLVGKRSTLYVSAADAPLHTALRADIIHGPLNANRITGTFETEGAPYVARPALPLPPGRYQVGIEAWVEDAPGDTRYGSNLSPNMPYPTARGRLNGPAFDYAVLYGSTSDAERMVMYATPTRKVPLGAFGSAGGPDQKHRFYQDVDAAPYVDPQTGALTDWYYSPRLSNRGSRVYPLGAWTAVRNADSAQLGIATANMYYRESGSDYLAVSKVEYKNAADLLATRGVPYSTTGGPSGTNFAFSDPVLRGRFQFNSDVVHLTEIGKLVFGECDKQHAIDHRQAFGDVLSRSDSRKWANVYGIDEGFYDLPGCADRDGIGAIFVASSQWPAGSPPPPMNDPRGLCEHSSKWGPDSYSTGQISCRISDNGRGFQPVPIKVRSSLGASDARGNQPILVLGTHLTNGDFNDQGDGPLNSGGPVIRQREVDALRNKVEKLLIGTGAGEWQVVNRTGASGATHPSNRMILLGDLNLYSHRYGEHYGLIRKLREKFGYALDVSMAFDNSHGETGGWSMHDVGGLGDACYQGASDWLAISSFATRFGPRMSFSSCADSQTLRYPWWSRTGDNERYDLIVLVGRGWELDDPVRAYRVMQEADTPTNPLAPPKQLGAAKSLGVRTKNLPSDSGNYKPRFSLNGSTSPGAPALYTDHKPVGAKLRIWAGDGQESR